MADQQSRGGQKVGPGRGESSDKHRELNTRQQGEEPAEGVAQRPAPGQPGGPKQAPKSGRSKS
jgi:hypothetical protein